LAQNWNRFRSVRLIGISLAGFNEDAFTDQVSLFDFMEENVKSVKNEKIDLVMDKIRNRHGTDKISRATLIKKVSRNSGDE
jgi:DNA polymerase-4